MENHWKNSTGMDLGLLRQNRKSLHKAVQLVSAFPRNLLAHDPTDGTASLEWKSANQGLESLPVISNDKSIKAGLEFNSFELDINVDEKRRSSMALESRTVPEGLAWLKSELSSLRLASDSVSLDLPYEIEKYDYSEPLSIDRQALQEYTILYQNAFEMLKEVVASQEDAYDIRCWPHHFDLATLLPLETDDAGEVVKSIGVGFSPGDDGIDEPYVYVNVWPQVDFEAIAKHSLPIGNWNQKGWSGAVLTYSEILISKNQKEAYQSFVDVAIQALLYEVSGK